MKGVVAGDQLRLPMVWDEWLHNHLLRAEAHQAIHVGEASGLALSGPADFTAYDLNHRDEFASWTWLHAAEHIRLAVAAGI